MIRTIGIFTGSALATGILIAALGVPELSATPDVRDAVQSPVVDTRPETPGTTPAIPPTPPEPEIIDSGEAMALIASTGIAEEVPTHDQAAGEPERPADGMTETARAASDLPQANEANWYAFWSPFRSEIAANGFVAELQRTTGLDFRVVKLKPGVYEVAFAYLDDNDIQDKLRQIASATGLDMSGG